MLLPVRKETLSSLFKIRCHLALAVVLASDVEDANIQAHLEALQTSVNVVAISPRAEVVRLILLDKFLGEHHKTAVHADRVGSETRTIQHRVTSTLSVALKDSPNRHDVALRVPPRTRLKKTQGSDNPRNADVVSAHKLALLLNQLWGFDLEVFVPKDVVVGIVFFEHCNLLGECVASAVVNQDWTEAGLLRQVFYWYKF